LGEWRRRRESGAPAPASAVRPATRKVPLLYYDSMRRAIAVGLARMS
jgi:hypothetical protein